MSSSPRSWCLLLMLLWCSHSWAGTVLSLRSARWPGMAVQGLQARLSDHGARQVNLVMQIAQLNVERLGWHRVGLQVDGLLTSEPGGRWRFQGQVMCRGAPGAGWTHAQGVVMVDTLANSLFATVQQDHARLSAAAPLDQLSHWQVSLDQLPAAWLRPGEGDGRDILFGRGTLSGELAVDLHDDGLQESGVFRGQDVSVSLPGIGFVGAGLAGSAQLAAHLDADGHLQRAHLQADLRRGQWTMQSWQANLGDAAAVRVGVQAEPDGHGGTGMALQWWDPGALRFDSMLQLDARGHLKDLVVDRLGVDLGLAYQHYGQSLQGSAWSGQPRQVSGQISGRLAWRPAGLQALALHLHDVAWATVDAPLNVQGLQGNVDWRPHGAGPVSTLAWQQLAVGRVVMPQGTTQWQSRDGQLHLLTPWHLGLWGGQLQLNSLTLVPQGGVLQWNAVASAQNLRLDEPARLLGLPGFPVIWSQTGVSLHGVNRQWWLDGSLQASLWGGRLTASGLRGQLAADMQLQSVTTDVRLEHIDLASFSSYADLGAVTGQVQGQVRGLHLLAGLGPQAFDLSLRSEGGGRLGQRAVSVLSALTGGNASSGLQGMMLHLFHSSAYVRFGLDARLADGNLLLGGLEHDSHGYTVVEGRGLPLPRLSGHDSQVPWSIALRRVKAAGGRTPGH
ncbi:hypothetical protein ACYJW8_04645 [Frateuria aurantia]